MKNTEKIALISCFGIVFFAAGWFSWKLSKNYLSQKQAVSAKPEILGAAINARGETVQISKQKAINSIDASHLGEVKAKSFLVFDLKSGKILAKNNFEEKLPIASLTKLMTAYVIYNNLDFLGNLTIHPKAFWEVEPSLNFSDSEKISVQNLFDAMLVGSANDAAFALAQGFESEKQKSFVEEMNKTAKQLNMNDSSFSNPAGYDSQQNFSTAKDLKILISQILKYPAFQNLGKKDRVTFESDGGRNYAINSTNKLIQKYPDLYAIKTGFTKESLGSMATILDYSGMEIVVLVLNSPQRETDTLLLRKAFYDANP